MCIRDRVIDVIDVDAGYADTDSAPKQVLTDVTWLIGAGDRYGLLGENGAGKSTLPDVILFDEPCSALDPISTLAIEDLMSSIVADRAIVIVTHNMEQASRVSNRTAFFYMGDMVEYDETDEIFQRPKDKRLNDYLTGMFS